MAILKKRSTFNGILIAFISKVKAGNFDSWYLCVAKCCDSCADCVDDCTSEFYSSHRSLEPKDLPSFQLIKVRTSIKTPARDKLLVIGDFVIECPPGKVATAVPMPVFEGFHVVDWKTVWLCLEEDIEPSD